ncbi:MAG TPA: lytic transglycosylase domain-containing protein [Kiritimatiellia bacterium]|nr:lytic transglycosylase domain-containing protein [Kiritimatiellia bacterium]
MVGLAVFMLRGVERAEGQIAVEEVTGLVSSWFENVEIDWEALPFRMPTQEDWRHFWGLVERALESESLEDLVWLRPYAELALGVLERSPGGEGYGAWLRQRMDYFWAAEEAMAPPAPPPQPGRPVPPPPARPQVILPPPQRPPSRPAVPPAEASKKASDFETWKARMEKRPPPARAEALVPRLRPIFKEEGVPDGLVWLAEVESSFNPEARSPVGALGLYQFMPATAERFGMALTPRDERVVPEKSARAAAQYLKFLNRRFDSWPLALAAYNAGEGRVGRLLRTHNATTFEEIAAHLPSETRMYVPKVRAVVLAREGQDLAGW